MNIIDKTKLSPEQVEQLDRSFGIKVQTVEMRLTLSFDSIGLGTHDLPLDRVVDGVREQLSVLWHIPATGADKHIPSEGHKETCRTRVGPMGAFELCDCGAYGEQGPPRDMWSLLSRFIKVEALSNKVELIKPCPADHEEVARLFDVCHICGQEVK